MSLADSVPHMSIREFILDSLIAYGQIKQAERLQDLLEVIAESTGHETPHTTLPEYMESTPDGFSMVSEDSDTESFTYTTSGVGEAWESESKGVRYSLSDAYLTISPTNDVVDTRDLVSHLNYLLPCCRQQELLCLLTLTASYRQTSGETTSDSLARLDCLMAAINRAYAHYVDSMPHKGNEPEVAYTHIDINEIREYYLLLCSELVEHSSSPYYVSTGDNPVLDDPTYLWSLTQESGGGWSRLDPTLEPDFSLRNELELDKELVNQADYDITESDRSYDYTRRLARSKLDREIRYEARLQTIQRTRTLHGLHVHMLAIELAYKRSLYTCERINDFTSIIITRKQLEAIRETYKACKSHLTPKDIQRRTLYLGHAVDLHQADCKLGNTKASQRIVSAFRAIDRSAIGSKYYTKLIDIKNRMFKHILRNISAADKAAYQATKINPSQGGYLDYLASIPMPD